MAYSRHVIALLAVAGCTPDEPAPVCAPVIATGDVSGGIAVDDTSVYALDTSGTLLRAPIGDDVQLLEPVTSVGVSGSHRILVDDADVWIGGQTGLTRIDKQTGTVERVDPELFIDAFALDDQYVYWDSLETYRGVVRRLKRGGPIEMLVPIGELGDIRSLTVATGRLYLVAATTSGEAKDNLYRYDFASHAVAFSFSSLPDGSLELIGPDEAGRLFEIESYPDGLTAIRRFETGTEIVRWTGSGLGPRGHSFASAHDGLYLAVPELEALMHYSPDGRERDFLLGANEIAGDNLGNRFAIGSDAVFASDGKRSIYKLPLAGRTPLCGR